MVRRREWRGRVGACLALAVASACVASSEVKVASAEVGSAIEELQISVDLFQAAVEVEVERAKGDLGKAIEARMVQQGMRDLIAGGDVSETFNFRERGLIDLSVELDEAQDEARRWVAQLDGAARTQGDDADQVLARLLAKQAEALEATAARFEDQGQTDLAAATRARIASLDLDAMDPEVRDYSVAYLNLAVIPDEMGPGLEDLKAVARVLAGTHAAVHGWIMADVTVSGAQVAAVVDEHAAAPAPRPDQKQSEVAQ